MRVLLLEVPQTLREIFEQAMQAGDECEIVKDMDDALTRAGRLPPDAIILGLTADEDATLVPTIFARWPLAKVMTVGQSHVATLYELFPSRRAYGHLSASEIATTLREAVRRDPGDFDSVNGESHAPVR